MLSFNVLPSNNMRMGQAICTIPGLVGVDPVEQFLDEWNRSIWFWIIDHPTKKLGTCLRYPLVTCSRDMFWSDNPVGLALLKKKKGYWPSWTSAKMIRCIPIHRAPNQKMLTTQVALLMMMTLQLHLCWQMPSMMSVVEIFACTLIKIISKLCPQDDGYKSQDEKWTIMMISIVHSKGRGFYPSTQMRNDEHYLGFSGSVHLLCLHLSWKSGRHPSPWQSCCPSTFLQASCPLRAALWAKRWEEFRLMQLHLGRSFTGKWGPWIDYNIFGKVFFICCSILDSYVVCISYMWYVNDIII